MRVSVTWHFGRVIVLWEQAAFFVRSGGQISHCVSLEWALTTSGLRCTRMRIKVESTPPLATFKAWFVVSAASSVQDLKESLCSDIPVLHEQEVTANEITLVLDGFELLDSSSIDVVRDGDLVK